MINRRNVTSCVTSCVSTSGQIKQAPGYGALIYMSVRGRGRHIAYKYDFYDNSHDCRALIGLVLIDNKQTDTFSYFDNVMTQLSIINGTYARKTNVN